LASASIALENVYFPHTFHQFGPGIVPWMGAARLRRLATIRLFSGAASVMMWEFGFRDEGNDSGSPASRRGKQPMIPYEIKHGWWNESRKLRHKLQWFEHNMRRAIAPAMSEKMSSVPTYGQLIRRIHGRKGLSYPSL
jgi:hypothetical protein